MGIEHHAERKAKFSVNAIICCIVAAGCHAGNSSNSSNGENSPTESPPKKTELTRQACDGTFGKVGGKALADLSEGWHVSPLTNNANKRMEKLAQKMRSEDPHGSSTQTEMRTICKFEAPTEQQSRRSAVVLKYGQGSTPRASKKRHLYYSAGSTLIDIDARHSQFMKIISNVYFTCSIPERNAITVRINLGTKWSHPDLTVQEENEKAGQILLAVSRKFSNELGCTNNLDLDPTSPVKPLPGGSGKPKDLNKPLPSLPESGPLVKQSD